ncbi:tail fiber assembly protein [uncultured Pseudodesulfovibrio sp.]|uniref:tail fiber assembly protein n=1 Tax=uncultured Pseudodesulfovibrio sp. TaxID=2035858 RepID=UPI0029C74705|nr:tail fiber assembly protein [uncultured Pseudodesulfovibrio sp.]
MWKYPDGTCRQNPPARVQYAGYIRNFADLSPAERDEIGFNEAMPCRREPFTVYETKWTKGEDLVFRETAISTVVDETARDAAEAETIRAQRDRMLAESDWTQLADAPLDDAERMLWAATRQSLRDVPQQAGFPHAVAWPENPMA